MTSLGTVLLITSRSVQSKFHTIGKRHYGTKRHLVDLLQLTHFFSFLVSVNLVYIHRLRNTTKYIKNHLTNNMKIKITLAL